MTTARPVSAAWSRLAEALSQPVRMVVSGFAVAIALGTVLLALPVAAEDGTRTGLVAALFTATSAVCVTGLVVVDTAGHWSTFGEAVILALIQVGGFGVMTMTSLLVLLVGKRLGVRVGMLTGAEARHDPLGLGTREIVVGVARTTLVVEAVLAVVLTARFAGGYGESLGRAAYLGLFHAVSAFNNAGFALWGDSLERYVADPWVTLPIAAAIVLGGLGFPVLWELRRAWRVPWTWSLHLRLTLFVTGVLLVTSTVVFTAVEWSNERTLGALSAPARLLAGMFHAVNTRTAGFNSVPVGDLQPESLFATDVLMFIGGGSGGTAGGIKVTTFGLLAFVIWAELRGDRKASALSRGISTEVQRQAVAVALIGVAAVVAGTWLLLAMTDLSLDVLLFEAVSAFGTVGLSTGITADLPSGAQLVLVGLMFLGRLGPATLGAALALRSRPRPYTFPEERAIVG